LKTLRNSMSKSPFNSGSEGDKEWTIDEGEA
jgi:hypothetical protein